jgi:Tfp pilus assembly protein PilF
MITKKRLYGILKNEITWVVFIFAVSMVLRIIYMAQNQTNPLYLHDSSRISYEWPPWFKPTPLWRSPTIPWAMHVLFYLCGNSYPVYRIAIFALGALNSVLIYYLAKKIFNPVVARIASFTAAIYVPLIFFEGNLLDPPFDIFLVIIWFSMLLKAFENPSGRRWYLCGILWSLAVLSRQHFFFFGTVLIAYMVFSFLKDKTKNKRNLYYGALFLAGFVTIIGYITARNIIIGKDFVLVAAQEGGTFYSANCVNSDDLTNAASWFTDHKTLNMPYWEGKVKSRSEYSRYFFKKAFKYISEHPIQWLRLLSRKFYMFWNGHEDMSDDYIYEYSKHSSLVRHLVSDKWIFYPFGIIGPLGIIGLMVAMREGLKAKLLAVFIIAYSLNFILFAPIARLKAPIVPFVIIAASYTLWWLFANLATSSGRKGILIYMPLFIALLILCNFYHFPVPDTGRAYLSLKTAWGYLKMKNIPAAIENIEKSAEIFKGKPNSNLYMQLADLYCKQNNAEKAIAAYKKATEADPKRAGSHLELARLLERVGRPGESIIEYEKAAGLSGLSQDEYVSLCYKLAGVYEKSGRPDLAIVMYEKLIKMNANNSYLAKRRIEALKKSAEKVIGGGTDKK